MYVQIIHTCMLCIQYVCDVMLSELITRGLGYE
jgi:hypothetical protein